LKCLDSPPASEANVTKGNNKTVISNEKNKKTPKNKINFSKYEILGKKEGLITYKYSNVERKSDHQLVYQYFFDEFDILEV